LVGPPQWRSGALFHSMRTPRGQSLH
jgi:hypothetical protein